MIAYRFSPEAERELDEALDYYEQQRAGLGIDFLNAAAQAIDPARRLPHAGTRIIVAVARQGRHADYWKSRLAKVRT